MKKSITFIVFLITCSPVFSQDWNTYPYYPTGSLISFPVDEGRHSSEPIEWWYTMGHLTGNSSGKHYSYMLSYFYYPANIFDGFRILNISDDDLGLFYGETKALNYNILATDSFNIEALVFTGGIETWHNKTDIAGKPLPFEYEISAASGNGKLNLEYNALKPPLILADSGYLIQGTSAYSYYYSQTKNEVIGTITINGVTENVNGTSWIDRQYGSFNPADGQEYEWFCIQLSNGMDLNINNIFTNDNKIPNTPAHRLLSAYVDESTQYTITDFEIERLKYSYMSDNTMCYSQKWRITSSINDLDITASTLHSHYEVKLPFRFYEGPITITGTVNGNNVKGIGFAELVHSYEKPDIEIVKFANLGDVATMVIWQLNNPDDGNPLKYDLEFSTDNKKTFIPIDQQVADTFYYWNTLDLAEQNDIWLKVTGYSNDYTLSNFSIEKLIPGSAAINKTKNQKPQYIYPNPSAGQFTVAGENIRKIEIFNVNGIIVYELILTKTKQLINLSPQQKGIYFVKLTTENGTITERIILN